ncbi:MAG: anti-sigma factor family protein [Gemmataceae bacterium]
MNCRVAHDLLLQSLDGPPIESPEWLAHLRHCGDCRELASAGRRLQDGLRLLAAPLPPPDLAERIAERVLRQRRRTRRRQRLRWAVGLALAASLLIALLSRLDWRTADAPQTANADRSPPSRATEAEAAPTLRESAAELGEVFTALKKQTTEETVGQARRWVSNVGSPALPKVDLTTLAAPSHPLREAGEGVSEGLQPVTTSARRAFDLFLRELPMEEMTN